MGRPSVLTLLQLSLLRSFVMKHRKDPGGVTAAGCRRALGLGHACIRTIQRAIVKTTGLKSFMRRVKACANPADARSRLAWAKGHVGYPFRKIHMWMDAKFFRMPLVCTQVRSTRVWRYFREGLHEWAVRASRTLKSPGVHVLAGISLAKGGRVLFAKVYTKMNSQTAVRMLTSAIHPALKRNFPTRRTFTIQMDGEPAFRSARFEGEMSRRHLRKFRIPPRSGDLAPIENAWGLVIKMLEKIITTTRKWRRGVKNNEHNRRAWSQLVVKTIKKLPAKTITNIIKSMPQRVAEVIDNRGGPTRW
jgi:hypothetical protein